MRPGILPRDREAARATWVVALLSSSLVLTAILAWQAADAARSQRAVTGAVLRDFAALGGGEFIRRATASVGYDGYYAIITALRGATPAVPPDTLPDRSAILRRLDGRSGAALDLALHFLRFDPASGGMATSGPLSGPVEEELGRSLRARLAKPGSGDRAYTVLNFVAAREAHCFVVAPLSPQERSAIVGFEVNLDALRPWFQRILERAPLLPPSLGRGKIGNNHLSLLVLDAGGRERWRSGAFPPSGFSAEVPFGDAYQGMFDGMKVRISLDASAAPGLVIGGLPRSRLPFLLVTLLLAVGFVAAGIQQLRRERALAALRTEFVSRVSHELRTPLTQIRMFAETLLLDRVRSEGERRRSLEIIDREVRRLSHLVDNILRFSRQERGALQLDPRPRDIGPLILDAVECFRPLARRGGVTLESRLSGDLRARVDEDALRQILLNLFDNAAKYGPEGQSIRVGATGGNGACRLWVEDEGPGVPPADRERIWEPFHRLDRDHEAAVAGTGIGLSVVRELTLLQGGRCWVEEAERGGARFVVEFAGEAAGADPRAAGADA